MINLVKFKWVKRYTLIIIIISSSSSNRTSGSYVVVSNNDNNTDGDEDINYNVDEQLKGNNNTDDLVENMSSPVWQRERDRHTNNTGPTSGHVTAGA